MGYFQIPPPIPNNPPSPRVRAPSLLKNNKLSLDGIYQI